MVVETNGQQATVRGRRATACGSCAGKASCSTMGSWKERLIELHVKNSLNAKVGDEVLLEVPDGLLMKVAFRLYMLPMLLFVVTGFSVSWLADAMHWLQPELIAAVAALLSVPISYLLLNSRVVSQTSLDIRMLRIVHQAEVHIPILPV